jgi:hypothetical protein
VNVAAVAAEETVTELGTDRLVSVFDSATFAPPEGAPWARVTVQVVEEFGPMVAGLHDTEDTVTALARRLTLVLTELLL